MEILHLGTWTVISLPGTLHGVSSRSALLGPGNDGQRFEHLQPIN